MPQSGVVAPREGRSHHEERPDGRGPDRPRAARTPAAAVRAPRAAETVRAPRAADGHAVRSPRRPNPDVAPAAAGSRPPARSEAPPQRRTITIRGRGSERYVPARSSSARRRPERRYERSGFRPDRTAMWAVLLGLMLILAAAASAHAATLHAVAQLH